MALQHAASGELIRLQRSDDDIAHFTSVALAKTEHMELIRLVLPKERDMPAIVEIVKGVSAMGMETCMTLGMLTPGQASQLAEAGLDYYNHNIDTSPENYPKVITTRSFQDRLDTLEEVRSAGISVCCGGIVGMGETREDRVGFIHALATLPRHMSSRFAGSTPPAKACSVP